MASAKLAVKYWPGRYTGYPETLVMRVQPYMVCKCTLES